MANNNARITLENRTKEKEDIVLKIKEKLNLDNLPRKIECFDISNMAGEYIVAGMCVAQKGVIKRNLTYYFYKNRCPDLRRRLRHAPCHSERSGGKQAVGHR